MTELNVPRMMTIREVAKTGILSEHCLRLMEKQGRLPCIYVGKRCLVNFDVLVQELQTLSGNESKGGINSEPT